MLWHTKTSDIGAPRADDRRVLNGIYWRLRTGSPWADNPERYGPATTCYNRFVWWRKIGVWGNDPPPLNWSTLRYVFGHEKEDRNAEKAPQA